MRKTTIYLKGSSILSDLLNKPKRKGARKRAKGTAGGSRTDIYERDGKIHYEMELPGLTREDIDLIIEDGKVVISGSYLKKEESERNYLKRGRQRGRVKEALPLPKRLDKPEKITSRFEDGILHLEVSLPEDKDQGKKEIHIE